MPDDRFDPTTMRRPWIFDVALSFSGKDRQEALALAETLAARHLSVFYDEWYQDVLLGQNLVLVLPEIYEHARFCVALLSSHYVEGPYPRREFVAMLERLLGDPEFLLPVRLDDQPVPGLPHGIVTVDYNREGPDWIANTVVKRLSMTRSRPPRASSDPATDPSHRPLSRPLPDHRRGPPRRSISISSGNLVAMARDARHFSTPSLRARLARELVIQLNWKHDAKLGTAYGAWDEDGKILLSTLPSLDAAQKTLEFELDRARNELVVTSEWTTEDSRYGPIAYYEWQPAVAGLTASRSVFDLDREVVIRLLEQKGAPFGYPIIPRSAHGPEKLCEWVHEEPPQDYMEWNRDPRLVPDGTGHWATVYHRSSGAWLLVFMLRGRWAAPAFYAMNQALRTLFPERHRVRVVSTGSVRISLLLGASSLHGWPVDTDVPTARRTCLRTLRLSYSLVARMAVAGRGIPVPPADASSSVPPPSGWQLSVLEQAESTIGEAEYPQLDYDEGSDWVKLHDDVPWEQTGLHSMPAGFSFGDVAVADEALAYIARTEAAEREAP
jgi:hypothetical protein